MKFLTYVKTHMMMVNGKEKDGGHHVQSGKTANYTGVISKAFDSGYKLVIILAGLLNSLRKQTQERIDEGIIGINSAKKLNDLKKEEKLIGVGKYS